MTVFLTWLTALPSILPAIWQAEQAIEGLIKTIRATNSAKDAAALEAIVRDVTARLAVENAAVQSTPLP